MRPLGTIAHRVDEATGSTRGKGKARKWWIVTCEPHVAMRIRRNFVGGARGQGNEVILSDTDANAFELEWVRQRYPLDVVEDAAATFPAAVARYRARQAAIEEMHAPNYVPPLFELAIPAREYQRFAAEMAVRSGGLLLTDDLGLGKTISAIAAISAPGGLPVLVVTLTHLCRQWARELERFAPALRVHIANSGRAYPLDSVVMTQRVDGKRRVVKRGEAQIPDVLIMNYQKLAGWADELIRIGPKTVIWDEVQELRHSETKKAEAARALREATIRCMGLSATPIYNYGSEIYNVIECIQPGALGTRMEFIDEWCSFSSIEGKEKVKDPEALRTYLLESGIMLRRRRKDVGRELPELSRIYHTVETDPAAIQAIEGDVAELARFILRREGERFDRMRAAGDLDGALRQATGLAKAKSVAGFVRMLVDGGERVVLYGWHHSVYGVWREELKDLGVAEYHGDVSIPAKEKAVADFREGRAKVFMISLRAGAGLDGLQFIGHTVVFGELDWSPGVHVQAEGRVHRDGQTEPVTAWYLVSEDGSDPVVQDVLGLKEWQRVGLVDGAAGESSLGSTSQADDVDRMRRLAEAFLKRRGLSL
jgi:SNF2 family DNA or RNA helicase